MKEYIKQFYNEGLATIFYKKPIAYIDKNIKNKNIVKFISLIIKIIYTILAICFAGYILYKKL
jgi:hypothetical protein